MSEEALPAFITVSERENSIYMKHACKPRTKQIFTKDRLFFCVCYDCRSNIPNLLNGKVVVG